MKTMLPVFALFAAALTLAPASAERNPRYASDRDVDAGSLRFEHQEQCHLVVLAAHQSDNERTTLFNASVANTCSSWADQAGTLVLVVDGRQVGIGKLTRAGGAVRVSIDERLKRLDSAQVLVDGKLMAGSPAQGLVQPFTIERSYSLSGR